MRLAYVLFISFFFVSFSHDVNVGLTNIEFNEENQMVEVCFKLDRKSLEFVFVHHYLYQANFENDQFQGKCEKIINDYISKNFKLLCNDQSVVLNFYKGEANETDVLLYFNQEINFKIDSVLVRNLLLLDADIYHKNIVFIKNSELLKGFILDKDENKINLKFTGTDNEAVN